MNRTTRPRHENVPWADCENRVEHKVGRKTLMLAVSEYASINAAGLKHSPRIAIGKMVVSLRTHALVNTLDQRL